MGLARFTRLLTPAFTATAMCLVASTAWAQGRVTGRVTAQDTNQPLTDARVLAVGTNAVASTNQDGRYTLNGVRTGTIEIQAFHVGYQPLKKTVTVTAGEAVTLDFQLTAAIVRLQDVVTTATGEQRKIELGNAVRDFHVEQPCALHQPLAMLGQLEDLAGISALSLEHR